MSKPLARTRRPSFKPPHLVVLLATSLLGQVGMVAAAETDNCAALDPTYKIYSSRNPVVRRADPFYFGASGVMGMQGFDSKGIVLPTEGTLLTSCRAYTPAGSLWPQSCDPSGMAEAMRLASGVGPAYTQSWAVFSIFGSRGVGAAQTIIARAMTKYSSPALIPLRSAAKEWAVVDKVCAKLDALGALVDIGALRYHDVANNVTIDDIYSDFEVNFYKLLRKFDQPCDPNCTAARYFNNYLVMYEPPPDEALMVSLRDAVAQELPVIPPRRPQGVVERGQRMTAELAQTQVWKAVDNARFVGGPVIMQARQTGAPAPAFRVHGFGPEGEAWVYYVTPIRANRGSGDVLTFVTLAAEDGSIQSLYTPAQPEPWQPITEQQALNFAAKLLRAGERFQPARLTYDLRLDHKSVGAPNHPFYEFPVMDATGIVREVVRVMLHSGEVLGRGPML